MKLTTYSKARLKVLGITKAQLRNPKNQKKYRVEFVVIKEDYTPLLGSVSALKMGLITVKQENILHVTGAVDKPNFEGLSMKEIKTETRTDPLTERTRNHQGGSLVVTEKPNAKLRVCIDPQHLNRALKRSHYPLPVIEDILLS